MSTLNSINLNSKNLIDKSRRAGVKPDEFIKNKIKIKLFKLDKYIEKKKNF